MVINGLTLATGLLTKEAHPVQEQPETLYVTPATYHDTNFPQKRTPTRYVPRRDKGSLEIKAIEQYLSSRYAMFQADSTATLLAADQEQEFNRLRTYLETNYPFWNTLPYADEMAFYRWHDTMRRRSVQAPK